MQYDYDVLTIGLGPAGIAVSAMASSMDLKVCAIESHHIGGECMNVGCIPSKALLRMAKTRNVVRLLNRMQLITNENLFQLDGMPDSLAIIGGGAIACEMAQAFARLGSKCTIILRGNRLLNTRR